MRFDRKPFLLEILGAGVLGVTSVHPISLHSYFPLAPEITSVEGGERVERTMAGVQADNEARLLFDFLRHRGGGGVVDGRWNPRRGNLGSAVGVGAAAKRLDVSRHVRVLKIHRANDSPSIELTCCTKCKKLS